MKLLTKIVAVYLVMWILTGLHSRFVWNRDTPCFGALPRSTCTVVFDFGLNGIGWPYYWIGMFQLGSWAWAPGRVSQTDKVKS